MLENPTSCQRTIAESLFQNKLSLRAKTNKFAREGFLVERFNANKCIDCTDDYTEALSIIENAPGMLVPFQCLESEAKAKMYFQLESRRIGNKLIRIGTPIESYHPNSV